jgi:hypothetical protein
MGVVNFTPRPLYLKEKRRGTHWIGGWVGHRADMDNVENRKISCACQESNYDSPATQPLTHRYTDWDIPARHCILFTSESYPCNRPWRPIGLWDLEGPTFSKRSAHRRRWDCQPYAPAPLYPPGRFLVLISVRDWVDPRATVRLELKKKSISSGLEPAIFRLVA